ncbi:MAG: YbaB/EbfC family nucleoid-associated protein [Chloroflexota bacterium]|nr:YbaB/EbfC family nucleoid-associated protein [Chloroflexota bacterium]
MDKSILRQAQQLQAKLIKAQEELDKLTVEATSGGGAVKIVMDGHQKVRSVEVSTEVIEASDAELLQDLVMTVVNEAVAKSQELANKHLSSLTGGLNMPGLF